MTPKPRSKGRAIAELLLVLVIWLPTIAHNSLGFVPPVNAEAVGFDFGTSLVWLLFAFVVWRFFSTFRSRN